MKEKEDSFGFFIINEVQCHKQPKSRGNWSFWQDSLLGGGGRVTKGKTIQFDSLIADSVLKA